MDKWHESCGESREALWSNRYRRCDRIIRMEQLPKTTEQDPIKELSGKEKFDIILGLFGTEQARENFISLCQEYYKARMEQAPPIEDAENYRSQRKVGYSPPRRAYVHNIIMETLTRLATESKNLTPVQESVLRDFHSRDNVAQAIKEYVFAGEDKDEEDDEDVVQKKKGDMSGPAYFHSLGREH